MNLPLVRLVYTSDGIGIAIRSGRSLTIACKSRNGVGSGIGSAAKSEGSEGFVFLPTPLLPQPLTTLCELVKRNRKQRRQSRSQGLLGVRNGGLEKTLANSRSRDLKLANHKARCRIETTKISNSFWDTWPAVCQGSRHFGRRWDPGDEVGTSGRISQSQSSFPALHKHSSHGKNLAASLTVDEKLTEAVRK